MRKTLLMSATLFGLGVTGAAPYALAQSGSASGQFPAAPGASSQTVQPSNSLPSGAGTSNSSRAGSALGTSPAPVMTPGTAASPPPRRVMRAQRPMRAPMASDAPADTADASAPPTSAYRGGAGAPSSTAASNTTAANTRSTIAPRLPDPGSASNSPEAFLAAAQRSLNAGRTGAAQEALERAETRLLSRSTDPSMANRPDDSAMIMQIGEARRALASRNTAAAKSAISSAMQGRTGA